MIYCVWYPSGGFGHFINTILSCYGKNFVRPQSDPIICSNGISHAVDVVLPKYQHNAKYQLPPINNSKNYSLLVDNGINDESETFKRVLPECTVIKLCYSNDSWPIIAKRHILTAMDVPLDSQMPLNDNWPTLESWAIREKYFLYLMQHPLRSAWKKSDNYCSIDLLDLTSYTTLHRLIESAGVECEDFSSLHQDMLEKNHTFFSSVEYAKQVIASIKNNQPIELGHITTLWDQAVVNYFIHSEFGLEVPANDYADWFKNSQEIINLL